MRLRIYLVPASSWVWVPMGMTGWVSSERVVNQARLNQLQQEYVAQGHMMKIILALSDLYRRGSTSTSGMV